MRTMDPRIARRRRLVGEDRARRRLRRLLLLLVLAGIGAFAVWLLRSPLLSIRDVVVTGAGHSDPAATAAALGIVPGVPTISVDETALLERLRADPWIARAEVDVTWPGTVTIDVTERDPSLSLVAGDAWWWVTADGWVVARLPGPQPGEARVEDPGAAPAIGNRLTSAAMLGAARFAGALTPALAAETTVIVDGERIRALVSGHPVDLGDPANMEEKAVVLAALLERGVPDGAVIELMAPRRPAVEAPPQVEGEGDPSTEPRPSD